MDNWFTSVTSAEKLFDSGLTMIGTIRKNKREIPIEFLPNKKNLIGQSIFGFNDFLTLVSYATKFNKSVLLLSTEHHSSEVAEENLNKPRIILDYNKYKGNWVKITLGF